MRTRREAMARAAFLLVGAMAAIRRPGTAASGPFSLPLRTRDAKKAPRISKRQFTASRSALILCDMWDDHWCSGAAQRVGRMVPRFVPAIEAARRAGFVVIHAPSDTMGFYAGKPERKKMLELQRAAMPAPVNRADPPLPVDAAAGGCDTPERFFKAWTRQHPGIPIDSGDFISDNGEEVYSLLKLRGIETLFVAGVHTNMCILNRSFAIKQMTRWGVPCVLLRDLTDAMYDPNARPFVSHERGTEMVVEYIEEHWCPSALSTDLIAALGRSSGA